MKHILLVLKGMLFGIANIIPGVSGGTMAVITGVYEKLLDSLNNLRKKFKPSIIFLLLFGLGAVVAVLAGAKGVKIAIEYMETPISLLFIGLILGSLPSVTKPVRRKLRWYHYIVMLLTFSLVIGLLYIPLPTPSTGSLKFYDYLILVCSGFLASVAMVVPGISGMMMFYLFGYYETLMSAISGLTSLSTIGSSVLILLPVAIGIIIGIFTAAKIISFLLKKFEIGTYAGIIGFVVGSVFALLYEGRVISDFIWLISSDEYLFIPTLYTTYAYNLFSLVLSIGCFIVGLFGSLVIASMSESKNKEKEETKAMVDAKREEVKQELLKEIEEMNKPKKVDSDD